MLLTPHPPPLGADQRVPVVPLFEAQLDLKVPHMVFSPSMEFGAGDSFFELVESLVTDLFRISSLVPRLAQHSPSASYQVANGRGKPSIAFPSQYLQQQSLPGVPSGRRGVHGRAGRDASPTHGACAGRHGNVLRVPQLPGALQLPLHGRQEGVHASLFAVWSRLQQFDRGRSPRQPTNSGELQGAGGQVGADHTVPSPLSCLAGIYIQVAINEYSKETKTLCVVFEMCLKDLRTSTWRCKLWSRFRCSKVG